MWEIFSYWKQTGLRQTLVNSYSGFHTLLRSKVSGCSEGWLLPCSGKPGPKGDAGIAHALTQGVQFHRFWAWVLIMGSVDSPWHGKRWARARVHPEALARSTRRWRQRQAWKRCVYEGPMLRRAISSVDTIQEAGPEMELETVTEAGTGSPGPSWNGVLGPWGEVTGEAGKRQSGPVVLSGSDSRLSEYGLDKCKGLVS